MSRWRFQPPMWAVLATVPALALLLALGTWQLRRGEQKAELLTQYAAVALQTARPLDPSQAGGAQPLRVRATGHYEAQRQLLLDNQSSHQRPGFQVWTPLRLDSGALVVVNRGWIPLTGRAHPPSPPAPEGTVQVEGYWRALGRAGLRNAEGGCQRAVAFPQIVNYPDAADLACLYGEPLADGELLLAPEAPGGFVREWHFDNGFPPERHYGYAAQWFALAATLLFLFIKLNLKRDHD
ncbi:MAG: SURF1 family protein [Nevskiaceae bacterium]|nr:MAG: SURF1 family protein [Nevskiaceae bacterium]